MVLTPDDKKFITETVAESVTAALNDVMVPALDSLETRVRNELASKEDLKEVGVKLDSIERKLDAQQNRLDKHNERIKNLEKIHPQGKHLTIAT